MHMMVAPNHPRLAVLAPGVRRAESPPTLFTCQIQCVVPPLPLQLFGATFMVAAPEHPLLEALTPGIQPGEVSLTTFRLRH